MNAVFYIDGRMPERMSLPFISQLYEITKPYCKSLPQIYELDGKEGLRYNVKYAEKIMNTFDDVIFVTNMTYFLDNSIVWNQEVKMPMVWILIDGEWKHICSLTTKELRNGHNLEKMYISGAFTDED